MSEHHDEQGTHPGHYEPTTDDLRVVTFLTRRRRIREATYGLDKRQGRRIVRRLNLKGDSDD